MQNSYKSILITAALLFCTSALHAQMGNLFNSKSSSKTDEPTIIHSDAMDMDMANDKIILLGNVDVQDPGMNIKCRKMIIYMDKSGKKKSNSDSGNVRQIDCIGDVVITQKKKDPTEPSQQAFAGKAVYFADEEKIILTEEPVVVKGGSRLEGEKITMYTKTDRVIVVRPVTTLRNNQNGSK